MYYTLQYQHSDTFHKAGERIAAAKDTLHIGQLKDCEVVLDNPTDFADELLAVIKPMTTGEGWVLIPCSEHVGTIVNGSPVSLMHQLNDGDRIFFEEGKQELLFKIRNDNDYSLDGGTQKIAAPMSRRLIATLVMLPLLLFGVLFWYMAKDYVHEKLVKNVQSSVLRISVDSVYYCRIVNGDTTIVDCFSYVAQENSAVSGTAFRTADGLLVTARHCIEPWLNNREVLEKSIDSITSTPILWALKAETYNQTNDGDTTYAVISLCEFYEGDKGMTPYGRKMLSSEFCYNSDNDDIVELGDWNTELYWRSIVRHNARTDMMLDDIAVYEAVEPGEIVLADSANIASLAARGERLHFMGYPNNEEQGFEKRDGKVLSTFEIESVIAHDGELTHGYSGGPAMAVDGGTVYAVGVLSVIDKKGKNRTYSVPVTAMKKGGKQ